MAKKARAHKRPDFSVPLVSSEVLITESAVEFAEFKTELMAEIRPRGAIAQMYADDLVAELSPNLGDGRVRRQRFELAI